MSFDECTPYPATEAEARASMELSMRWALRGFRALLRRPSRRGRCSASCRAGCTPRCALASLAALEADRLRGTRDRRPRGRARARRSATAVLDGAAAAHAARTSRATSWAWAGPRTSSRRCAAGSTCSTASCRRATPATPICSRARGVDQYPQRGAPEGHGPDRGGLRLLHLPQLQPQLPAAPRQVRRDPGLAPQHHPQPVFLSAADGRDPRGDRGGPVCRATRPSSTRCSAGAQRGGGLAAVREAAGALRYTAAPLYTAGFVPRRPPK